MEDKMEQRMRTDNNTIGCAWCSKDLSHATQVRYLNGSLPVCDLCLWTTCPPGKMKGAYYKLFGYSDDPDLYHLERCAFIPDKKGE